jgi:hypothetical protein
MESKTRYISFVTTPSIEKALREASEKDDRSLSWIIGKALELYLMEEGHLKKQKPADR